MSAINRNQRRRRCCWKDGPSQRPSVIPRSTRDVVEDRSFACNYSVTVSLSDRISGGVVLRQLCELFVPPPPPKLAALSEAAARLSVRLSVCLAHKWRTLQQWLLENTNRKPHAGSRTHRQAYDHQKSTDQL